MSAGRRPPAAGTGLVVNRAKPGANLRGGVLHVPRLEGVVVLAVEELGGLGVQVAIGHLVPATSNRVSLVLAQRSVALQIRQGPSGLTFHG